MFNYSVEVLKLEKISLFKIGAFLIGIVGFHFLNFRV